MTNAEIKKAVENGYEITSGITATRAGLVFRSSLSITAEYFPRNGHIDLTKPSIIPWHDVAERLRYRDGDPWSAVSDRDDDMPVACGYGNPIEWGGIDAAYILHRLAVILCDDANAFHILYWCIANLGDRSEIA